MAYRARIKWRGKKHPVQTQWKAARKGMRYPAPVQVYGKPGKRNKKTGDVQGAKIRTQYDNAMLADLRRLQVSEAAFKAIRRIGGFLFNQDGNQQFAKAWNKLLGLTAHIPYPLPGKTKAIAQGILCDGNVVTVLEARNGFARIAPQVARLYEVEIGSDKMFAGGLYWRVVPDKKTGEIWIDNSLLERI